MSDKESFLARTLPKLVFLLLATYLVITSFRSYSDTTSLWVTASVITFAVCWANASHLLGAKPTLLFIVLAVGIGWFAEHMGATRGWFFGHYTYTDVLGPRLGAVPIVVPLMWFALTYMGYVLANLIVWHHPVDRSDNLGEMAVVSLLAAMIVTAYDLGMETYMVQVLKAWIMDSTDGAWFGETVQGFIGWAGISFVIIFSFRLLHRNRELKSMGSFTRRHALVPVLIYLGLMVSQVFNGFPVETRSIAAFVMGIPVLAALAGWRYWLQDNPKKAD
jgi:uncharacterized membrane protein